MKIKYFVLLILGAAAFLHSQEGKTPGYDSKLYGEIRTGDVLPQMREWRKEDRIWKARKPDGLDEIIKNKKLEFAVLLTASHFRQPDIETLKKCMADFTPQGVVFMVIDPEVTFREGEKIEHKYSKDGIFPERLLGFPTFHIEDSDSLILDKKRNVLGKFDVTELPRYLKICQIASAKGEELKAVFKPEEKAVFSTFLDTVGKNIKKLKDQKEITRILFRMEVNLPYYFTDKKIAQKALSILDKSKKNIQDRNVLNRGNTLGTVKGNPKAIHMLTIDLMRNWKNPEAADVFCSALTTAGKYDPAVLKLFISILDKKQKYTPEFIERVVKAMGETRAVKSIEYLVKFGPINEEKRIDRPRNLPPSPYNKIILYSLVRLSLEPGALNGYTRGLLRGQLSVRASYKRNEEYLEKMLEVDRLVKARDEWTTYRWQEWLKSNRKLLTRQFQDEKKEYLKPETLPK